MALGALFCSVLWLGQVALLLDFALGLPLVCSPVFKQELLPDVLRWRAAQVLGSEDAKTAALMRAVAQQHCGNGPESSALVLADCPQGAALLAMLCRQNVISGGKSHSSWDAAIAAIRDEWLRIAAVAFPRGMVAFAPAYYTDVGLPLSELTQNLQLLAAGGPPDSWLSWPPPSDHPALGSLGLARAGISFGKADIGGGRAIAHLERLIGKYRLRLPAGPACVGADQHCQRGGHCYTPAYAEAFAAYRTSLSALLAIGVCAGGSVAAWADFFPHATVFGYDISLVANLTALAYFRGLSAEAAGRIRLFQADSTRMPGTPGGPPADLPLVDVVVDDGGHAPHEITATFENLFTRVLRPGGLWVVEDVEDVDAMAGFLQRLHRATQARDPHSGFTGGGPELHTLHLAGVSDPVDAWVESVELRRNMIFVRKRAGAHGVLGRTWLEMAAIGGHGMVL